MQVELSYGTAQRFECDIDPQRRFVLHRGPISRSDLRDRLKKQLTSPLDFPPLDQACISDDRVVLALDRGTPCADVLVAGVWDVLSQRGMSPDSIQILQPPPAYGQVYRDPRGLLPEDIRNQISWRIHDPDDAKQLAYLAATAQGERIYLARDLTDADVTISIGSVAFDPVLGCRGTHSAFYPGLSNREASARTRGEGHQELGPEELRPIRQTIDEVAWLLGTLFSIQVVPGAGGGAADIFAGSCETVFRRGKQLLNEYWRVPVPERVDLVVVAIDSEPNGICTWDQIGSAIATAQRIVTRGGRIVVLSEMAQEPGPSLELVRTQQAARAAIPHIRKLAADDFVSATQIATAVDWARVFFLSRLPGATVEELFMVPLESDKQAAKLLMGDESCALVGGAQHAWAEVRGDSAEKE